MRINKDTAPNHRTAAVVLGSTVLAVVTVLWCGARPASAVPARGVAHADQADLGDVARRLPLRGSLRVEGVPFEGDSAALELERFEAFAPDAQVIIAGRNGEVALHAPDNAYYRGAVEGDLGAVAVLTARADGRVRGLIMKNGVPWVIDQERDRTRPAFGLKTRRIDFAHEFAGRRFQCGADDLLVPPAPAGEAAVLAEPSTAATTVNYTARVAVETDYEFFQLFGNTTDATDYVGDLFAYASTIYEAEVNTSLVVSYLKLWTTSADPWTQTSCNGALNEFTNYWNQNNGGVNRTVAHMLSGKNTGCGIAYLGVLCNTPYGYGLSGSLGGTFNIQSPNVVWDIIVVSHEIGHNFNSPHTHCYNGIGGSTQPVDQCYGNESGCYAGATRLPCSVGPGQGCGTIMSYCHLLSGGYGNITLTFGLGFQYGVLPGRVPTRMHDFVVTRAANAPSCLQYIAPSVTQTPAATPTRTVPPSPTRTATLAPTRSFTPTPVATPTRTIPASPTRTATLAATRTATAIVNSTPTRTATVAVPTPTSTPVPATPTSTVPPATATFTLPPATPTPPPVPSSTPTASPTVPAAVTLRASRDSWIDVSTPAQNKGKDINLRVLGALGRTRRTLVSFDLSTLPTSACVGSAKLMLKLTGTQYVPRTFAVHRIVQSWSEGTGGTNTGVTWNRRDGITTWTKAGGDFAGTPTASVGTGTINGATLQWNVTADVAAFRSGTAPNYGWLIKDASEGFGSEFRFASRESITVAIRPQLKVSFVPCP